MPPGQIDFAQLAQAALSAAKRLVEQWLPDGHREGHEWKARNPTRNDRRIGSFSINLATGAWADFADDAARGGDLVSLYAYLFTGRDQGKAAKELAASLGVDAQPLSEAPASRRAANEGRKRSPTWTPIVPVPEDADPAPVAHPFRGRPERTWAYRNADGRLLGYVYRFRTSDGGKDLIPLVYAASGGQREWRWQQWAQPRPLYGLEHLRADGPVLVVEGEKCVDAAREAIGAAISVVTWPGGGKAVERADWSPLAGRDVVIWPDADAQRDKVSGSVLPEQRQPGMQAASKVAIILGARGARVRLVDIPAPGVKPDGWDVADMVAEGADADQVLAFARRQRQPDAPTRAAQAKGQSAGGEHVEDISERLLVKRGDVQACLANVVAILSGDQRWQGVVAEDQFAVRVVKRRPVPGTDEADLGEWTDIDTSRTIIWLTEHYRVAPSQEIVDRAIDVVARANGYHPVREWLDGLQWDGLDRLDYWLSDFLGVPRTDYARRVGRWFLIAMVARVRSPGAKFDYCLVLEGAQGRRKSSALRALAGEWFSDTELDLTNKDSLSVIRGKWLHEFGELGSIARAESTRQKSFLSRQIDEFRPAYARREIRCPRQLVFAGTTNEWQWQKDPTGGRRFWPVEVVDDIEVDELASVRDQLFAEAQHRWAQGERYWPSSDEQRQLFDPEQLRRESEDPFFDALHGWIEVLNKPEFTLAEAMTEALKLDAGRMTRDVTTRVGMLLKKLGCARLERRNGVSRFVYALPGWSRYMRAQQVSTAEDRDGHALPV